MITITNKTAMQIWARLGRVDATACSPAQGSPSARELWQADLGQLGVEATRKSPVHVLVGSPGDRICSERVRNHVWSGRIPPGSLYHLAPGVLVASPEFCCLQEAARASLPRVTMMLMECLGLYGLSEGSRGFLDRGPLFGRDEFGSYLDHARGCMGVRKARRALGLALARSRPPLETKTAILLTFPAKLGGYGMPRPQMNHTILPTAEDLPFSQFASYEVDLCWPERRAVVEVDSKRYHSSAERLDADAKRRNSLKSMGWKVTTVTSGQLSGDALDVLARQVGRDLWVEPARPSPERRDWLVGELS